MAKPIARVTGNFNRIARDLDRAVRYARFGETDGFLFSEARELSWSFAKDDAVPFRFNYSALGRISGLHRTGLAFRCRLLIERGVFRDLGDGSMLINKDYRHWIAPADHVHPDGHAVRYAPDGRAYQLTVEQLEKCFAIMREATIDEPTLTPESPLSPPLRAHSHPPESPVINTREPTLTPLRAHSQAHIEERAQRVKYERESPERETHPAGAGAGAREDGEPFHTDAPPAPQPDPAVINDPAEVARVADFAMQLFGTLAVGGQVSTYARMYPVGWIRRAVEEADAGGKRDWRYVLGILRRYQVQGDMDAPPAPNGAPRPIAARPLSRRDAQLAEARRMVAEQKERNRMEAERNGDG